MSVYLHLFHGRNSVDEDMDDWGFDGPVIGPLDYVHVTYMCDVKAACSYAVALEFFPREAATHLKYADINDREPEDHKIDLHWQVVEGLLEYRGQYFGDFSVSTSESG